MQCIDILEYLFCVKEGDCTSSTAVLAREHHRAGNLLHGQVPDVAPQLAPVNQSEVSIENINQSEASIYLQVGQHVSLGLQLLQTRWPA